jgi:hypothetical protein
LSATVSWTIPTDNGSPITSFTVLIGKAGSYYHSVSRRFISPTDTSVTVTGLAAGQSYWVQVKAINGFGPGPNAYAGAVTPNP